LARLSREESRALTRAKLLASAREVVAREGYENASVDRIAEEAGFSKGAFYSNFGSKEEIILELLESHSMQDLSEIRGLVGDVTAPEQLIEIIGDWVHSRSADPSWGMLAMEFFRRARRDATFGERHANLFREQWRGLGHILLSMFPPNQAPADPETLGGLVFELTYGTAAGFKAGPTARDLVCLALRSLYAAYGQHHLGRPATAGSADLPAPRKRARATTP